MTERWKYQLKTGGFWGVFMIIFTTVFALKEKPFATQITDSNYYIRAAGFLLFGVFALGYSSWKAKIKRENKP
jgi:hypothetical protein